MYATISGGGGGGGNCGGLVLVGGRQLSANQPIRGRNGSGLSLSVADGRQLRLARPIGNGARARPASAAASRKERSASAIPVVDPRARYLMNHPPAIRASSPSRHGGRQSEKRWLYRNDHASANAAVVTIDGHQIRSGSSDFPDAGRFLVKTFGQPPPGTVGFSRPESLEEQNRGLPLDSGGQVSSSHPISSAHGLQQIRHNLGSWVNGGGRSERGGSLGEYESDEDVAEDTRGYRSGFHHAQSREDLRRELATMAAELSRSHGHRR
jgi:hypothetical protein